MPVNPEIEPAGIKIQIDAKKPSEDAVLEHWLLIADAIKKIENEKPTLEKKEE